MLMIPATFNKVLESLNVPMATVADLKTGEIHLLGEPESVENTDLLTSLFADSETLESLSRSLEGQILPQIWNQGQVSCVVCKPTDTTLVGLFVKDDLDAVEQYRWSQRANKAIQESFQKVE